MKSGAITPTAATDLASRQVQTYQLLLVVAEPVRVTVGRFGTFEFPAGLYCYTGSARRNFEARVRRHLSAEKKLRWHIDYLLSAPGVTVVEVRRHVDGECRVNQATPGEVLIPGFGASDCQSGCGAHLKLLTVPNFRANLASTS